MRKILTGMVCCFMTVFAFAQAENEANIREMIKLPVPPSPNAAALGKFGEIPVGLNTGIPSISVPLFSWKDDLKEMSMDISLNYHAGGHKVEDMASNVGLGWALNAGGVVSRTVRGIPDDGTNGFLNTSVLPSINTNPNDHFTDLPVSANDGITYSNSAHYLTVKGITDKTLDGEFDIWNLSVGNISARFFIDKNGGVNFFEQKNLTITYARSPGGVQPINKFTLVDDRAITYIFDVYEGTDAVPEQTIPGQIGVGCTSSFYLSKMISADTKDTIFITYSGGGNLYYEGNFVQTYRSTYTGLVLTSSEMDWSYSTIHTTNQARIAQIRFPDSTQVNFAYTFARADYYGDHALTSVTISNGSLSKKFNLSYSYFNADDDPYSEPLWSVNDYNKRLKLLQVQEVSGTDSIPPYIFEYNAQNLPPRNSMAQDHWGYFRGFGVGASLIPYIYFPAGTGPSQIGDASRYAQEQYCKASVLEKIIYPTGGHTRFTYHINDSQTELYNNRISKDSVTMDQFVASGSFPMTGRNSDTVNVRVQLFNHLPLPENTPWDGDCEFTITVKSTDNTVTRTVTGSYYQLVGPVYATFLLPQNKTYVVFYETGCMWWLEDFHITVKYEYLIPPNAKNVGGLRVEMVEDNDSLGNKIFTQYTYKTYDNKSSGKLFTLPNYAFYKSTTMRSGVPDWHWSISSTPSQSLTYYRGSPIVYTRVKVNKSTPSTNIGYSIHEFSDVFTVEPGSDHFPFVQPITDGEMSVPVRDSIFNSSNQLVKLVRREYASQAFGYDSAKYRCMVTGLIYNNDQGTFNEYAYAAKAYASSYGRRLLSRSTEVLYSLGDSIRTVTEYTYDWNKFLVTKQKIYNSVGEEVETRFYYPFNYSIATDERSSSVIAREVFKKQIGTWYLVDGLVNEFAQFNGTFLKQKKMIAAELVGPMSEATVGAFNPAVLARHGSFKDQVEFLSYDSKGRYTEIKTINKPVTSLIWCTTRNYPMAIVDNSSHINVAFTSFETTDAGNWSGIATGNIQTAIAVTGGKFYQQTGFSISKTGLTSSVYYVVSYWSKNGAYSIIGTQAGYPKTLRTVGSGGDTWTLYEHLVTGQTTVTITGSGSIDELRLYPRGSQMATYTYKAMAGISSQCDANNKIIHYEYDGLGRLTLIRDQDKNILKKFEYKYRYTVQ